jgi:archaellum biogenesis protein FlaJ (TadC family)
MNPLYIIYPMMLAWFTLGLRLFCVVYKLRHQNPVNKIELSRAERRYKWFVILGVPTMIVVMLLIYIVFPEYFEWKQN